jgi:hypothetical protein
MNSDEASRKGALKINAACVNAQKVNILNRFEALLD